MPKFLPIAVLLFLSLGFVSHAKGCAAQITGQVEPWAVTLEDLERITPSYFQGYPLYQWSSRRWRRFSHQISPSQLDALRNYISFFSRNPTKTESTLRDRFSELPEEKRYLLGVVDNTLAALLLIRYCDERVQWREDTLGFALSQLRNLVEASDLLQGNGRIVFQVGLWAVREEPHRIPEFLQVLRASQWSHIEHSRLFSLISPIERPG